MEFKVLTAVKISLVVFSVVTLCGIVVVSNVSEDHSASIFKAEVDVNHCKPDQHRILCNDFRYHRDYSRGLYL
jgi:hypothetical protein